MEKGWAPPSQKAGADKKKVVSDDSLPNERKDQGTALHLPAS